MAKILKNSNASAEQVAKMKAKERFSIPYNMKIALLWLLAIGVYLLYSAVIENRLIAFFLTLMCVGITVSSVKYGKNYGRHCEFEQETGQRYEQTFRSFMRVLSVILLLYFTYAIALGDSRASGTEFHEQMIDTFKPIVSSLKDYIPRGRNVAYDLTGEESRDFALHAIVINHIALFAITLNVLAWVIWRIRASSFMEYIDSSEVFSRMAVPYYNVESYPKFSIIVYLYISFMGCIGVFFYQFYYQCDPIDAEKHYFMIKDFFMIGVSWNCIFAFIPSIVSTLLKVITLSKSPNE